MRNDEPPEQDERALLEAVLTEQSTRWNQGDRLLVEEYLVRYPALNNNSENVLDLIYQEFRLRRRSGESPDPADYVERFPAWSEELVRQFAMDEVMQSAGDVTHELGIGLADTQRGRAASAKGENRAPALEIDGYEFLGELGRGGMGVVYKARHLRLGRWVAVKTIIEAQHASPAQRARFEVEAHAIARLNHPNIVQIHEVGDHQGRPYLTLEYADGGSLAERLAEGPMATRQAAELVETVARAVHAAHQAGVVHRDLKPSNVLLTALMVPKVGDFGLAKLVDDDSVRTFSGQPIGTPSYMAPEQAEGRSKDAGAAADIYALGAILYESTTGRPPFLGGSTIETLKLVVSTKAVPPRRLRPEVPRDLETICLKCLTKEPEKRYASALALAEDLRRFLDGLPIEARPVRPWERSWRWCRRNPKIASVSAAAVLFAAIAYLGLTYWHDRELRAEIRRSQATAASGLVQQLFKVDTPEVPSIVEAIGTYRRLTDPELLRAMAATSADPKVKLHASLALLPVDPGQVPYLESRLLGALSGELPVLRAALQPYRAEVTPKLWNALESAGPEDPRLLPAAGALALYDALSPRWDSLAGKVAEALVVENTLVVGARLEALQPVHSKMSGALAAIFRDKSRSQADHSRVADILVRLGREEPSFLADLLMDADENIYRKLFLVAEPRAEGMLPRFRAELTKGARFAWNEPPIDLSWTKPAPEIVGRIEMAQGLIAERFAFCQMMLLSDFLSTAESLRKSGYRPVRARPFNDGQEVKVAAIWARDARAWRLASGLSADEVRKQDEANRQNRFIPVDLAGYVATDAHGKASDRYCILWVERINPGEEARIMVGETFVELTMVLKQLVEEKLIGRSMNVFRSAGGRLRCSAVLGRSQSVAPEPGFFHYWYESEKALLATKPPERDYIFFDVTIHPVEAPAVLGEIARDRIAAAKPRLDADPHDWNARIDRAFAFIRLGDDQNALVDFDALVNESPADRVADYQCGRAVIHARLGHRKEALADLAKAQKGKTSGSAAVYSAAVVAAEIGEGEQDAFERLESVLKENPGDNLVLYNASCAYSLASRAVSRKDKSRGGVYAERAIALFRAMIRNGYHLHYQIASDPDFDPIRNLPGFALAMRGEHVDRLAGAYFEYDGSHEARPSIGLDPAAHLKNSRDLVAQGYRPVSLSVCRTEPNGSLVTASVWHRTLVTEPVKDELIERQARAAVALFRLGQADQVWPLLKHSTDPRLRSFIVNWLSSLGADPRVLAAEFDGLNSTALSTPAGGQQSMDAVLFHPETSTRRALILALGTFGAERLSPGDRDPLIVKLLDLYRDDPDSGIHGAAEWTLRQWGQQMKIETIDGALPQLKDRGSRRWYVNGQGHTFAVVDGAGKFRMGSPPEEPERDFDEALHSQEIPYRFAIATKEVTRGQFQTFLRENPQFDLNREDLDKYSPEEDGPRIFVTWFGAAAYCNWLSKMEGLPKEQWCYAPNAKGEYASGMTIAADFLRRTGYRLPTEAEWECACRAGASTSRYFGFSVALLERYAWYAKNFGDPPHPQRCGRLLPNDLGLFDMLGNVSEWCQEAYVPYQLSRTSGAIGEVTDVSENRPRVHRGGGFDNRPSFTRSADRTMGLLLDLSGDVGFRPARTMP